MKLAAVLVCTMAIAAVAETSELSILSTYGDRAFRPGPGTLCIVTELGDTLVFTDQSDPEYMEDYAVYELSDFLPEQNCWVITESFCGWDVIHLVNGLNGGITDAVSLPEPSPDGTRLLCTHKDIVVGMLWNVMQIWRVYPDSLVLEFQYRNEPWGPLGAGWAGDGLIVFDSLIFHKSLDEFSHHPGSLRLSADGIWTPDDEDD
ncbi:MAG: hypothetical protein QUS11_02705 [Candidatus Fermentibacter sp.]|nr:hypothetical protein [Candidatus Fermentibacter sp.]